MSSYVFPFQISTISLIPDLTETLSDDLRLIKTSLKANTKYLNFLEESISDNKIKEKLVLDPFNFSSISLTGIIDPPRLKESELQITYITQAPLKDLYGYPLLKIDKKLLESQYPERLFNLDDFKIRIRASGVQLNLYSIAGLERKKYLNKKQQEILKTEKVLFKKFKTTQNLIHIFLIGITLFILILVVRFGLLNFGECLAVFSIGVPMFFLLNGNFARGSGFNKENDFLKISKKHQKQIEQKLNQITKASYRNNQIDLSSYELLLKSNNTRLVASSTIEYFFGGYIVGGCHEDVPGLKRFIKLNELKSCYSK